MTVPAHVLAAVRSIPHPRQEPDMTAPHPSPAEQAVIDRSGIFGTEDFARWVVSLDDDDPDSPGRIARRTVTLNEIVARASAALRGDRG